MGKYTRETDKKRRKTEENHAQNGFLAGWDVGNSAECTKYHEQMFLSICVSIFVKKWKTKWENY
jgi:hypothetical protein